jgi:Peptidase family M28/PA domain
MKVRVVTLAVVAVMAAGAAAAQQKASPDAQRWWAHVQFLADDSLEGRNTGSEGHKKAAAYIADRFKQAGLQPAGTSGYLQPVAFVSRQIVEAESSLALVRNGSAEAVPLGPEAAISMRAPTAPEVEAPLVFAGYGLTIPEAKHDDFADLDVRGKIVVMLTGSPAGVPGPLSAHYQSADVRAANLKRVGAIGTVTISNPRTTDVPWDRSTLARLQPAMSLASASSAGASGASSAADGELKIALTVNPATAERWFAGSGHTFAELLAIADARKELPRFALQGALRAKVKVETTQLTSDNVAAKLTGSDPALKNEYVVLTAHLDHLGVGGAINGDRIYNGAMDNASGIATLIETAATLAKQPARPKRSVLFVAVTGEEKGLLGSRYFATNPTVSAETIVANINMDMFLPLYPFKILTVFGLDESDLGATARTVASSNGIAVQADPEPARNRFIRSDQYSFIRQGIPALALKVGYEPGSPQAAIAAAWTKERYHAPSDDLQQPVDLEAAAGFTALLGKLADAVANQPQRPRWNDASFFKRFAPQDRPSAP